MKRAAESIRAGESSRLTFQRSEPAEAAKLAAHTLLFAGLTAPGLQAIFSCWPLRRFRMRR
jgi:hypothetical protein